MELIQVIEFASRKFKLDCQHIPLMASEVADAIGLKYGRLFLQVKTKFHVK